MTDTQRRAAAKQFAADWQGKGYEKGHSQTFWLSLLQKVYGVEEPDKFITFEDQIMLDHTSFIDGFIPSTHVLIEQKSLGKKLNKPIKQSDGSLLSPFQQAKRYAAPGYEGVRCNAQLTAGQVRRVCRMTPGAEQLLRTSYDALGLSARAHDRILRVARTVADLAGKSLLDEDALLEALQYRAQEKAELTF